MKQYLDTLQYILDHGRVRPDRTGTGTLGVFGHQYRVDLTQGFPLLTTKQMFVKGIVSELLWLLRGETNITPLVRDGVSIWTDWPLRRFNKDRGGFTGNAGPLSKVDFERLLINDPGFATQWGELGPVYGAQWRAWPGNEMECAWFTDADDPAKWQVREPEIIDGRRTWEGTDATYMRQRPIDQISGVLDSLRSNPFGRRHIVSAWNPADIPAMEVSGLPPCHCLFQFNVRTMTTEERQLWFEDKSSGEIAGSEKIEVPCYYLDCHLYQRSADVFLGVPYNLASYSLLTHLMAQQLGMAAGDFVHSFGDLHIYSNHMDQVREQLSRAPLPLPTLVIKRRPDSLFDYDKSDFAFTNYQSHPAISAPIAV